MNNSVYGKFSEDVRKRINFALVNCPKSLEKRIAKPTYKKSVVFNSELVGVHMHKREILLNKPIFIGQCILDQSKLDMADFHYNVMVKKYGSKINMLMTDTDSFIYSIETGDLCADMMGMSERFDLSNYPKDHPLFSRKNEKQLYKMKDELGGKIMTEFCGIRSKMYSYQKYGGSDDHRAKGIGHSASKRLTHQMYLDALNLKPMEKVSFKSMKSKKHVIYTATITKTGLSALDDKRYILTDGITTLAHGHKDI